MSSTWEEASRCPDDSTQGRVTNRKPVKGGGQLVTLQCPQTRCQYYEEGWIVQVRPDNTIPDRLDVNTRERQFAPTPVAHQRRAQVLRALENQLEKEQKAGAEVPNIPGF